MRGFIIGLELFLLTFLVGCGKPAKSYEPRPDFYLSVYPRFIFWSLEAEVKADIFLEPSNDNCHVHLIWQDNRSSWDVDERSPRLMQRNIRLRNLGAGEYKIVVVVQKCDGKQERREFPFKVLEGIP